MTAFTVSPLTGLVHKVSCPSCIENLPRVLQERLDEVRAEMHTLAMEEKELVNELMYVKRSAK